MDVPRGTEIIEVTDLIIQVAITVGGPGVSSLQSPFCTADELSFPTIKETSGLSTGTQTM